jgi:transcription-repair coupling factor (superfamily II helicase)
MDFVAGDNGRTKLRPDHKIIFRRDWIRGTDRLRGVRKLAEKLAAIATQNAD